MSSRPVLVGGRRPATIAEYQWEVEAEKIPFDSLAGIRSSAEKWTAAIATILGLFAVVSLVKGPSDIAKVEIWWTIVVAAATLGAVACAIWATVLSSRAAYAWPKKVFAVGSELRKHHRTEGELASEQLKSAIGYAVRAAALTALAVAVLWFTTPRDPAALSSVMVITTDGDVVCGTLQSAEDDESLSIKPKDENARTIDSSDIASATGVAACP